LVTRSEPPLHRGQPSTAEFIIAIIPNAAATPSTTGRTGLGGRTLIYGQRAYAQIQRPMRCGFRQGSDSGPRIPLRPEERGQSELTIKELPNLDPIHLSFLRLRWAAPCGIISGGSKTHLDAERNVKASTVHIAPRPPASSLSEARIHRRAAPRPR